MGSAQAHCGTGRLTQAQAVMTQSDSSVARHHESSSEVNDDVAVSTHKSLPFNTEATVSKLKPSAPNRDGPLAIGSAHCARRPCPPVSLGGGLQRFHLRKR
jgi:hypothetical protein